MYNNPTVTKMYFFNYFNCHTNDDVTISWEDTMANEIMYPLHRLRLLVKITPVLYTDQSKSI